jgi:hypothetical protein
VIWRCGPISHDGLPSTYLGDINMNQANEVQPLMAALAKVAEHYRCAVVCVRHPSKPGPGVGKVIHRGMGSVAFIGSVRTALFAEQHPRDKDKVLLAQSKSNVGSKGRTQLFSKAEGMFVWCGVSRLDAELLGGSGRGPDPHAFIGAACWLEEHMEPGIPIPSKDIEAQMYEDGYSKDMIQRVKRALGIRSAKAGDRWIWTLPSLSTISTPTTTVTSPSYPTSPSSTTSIPSMESGACGHDTQDAGETEETEEREDTEVTAIVSGYCDSDIDQDAAGLLGTDSGHYVPHHPDAPPKVADVDTPLADMAKASRKKAGARHSDLCMFGNWTATRSPVGGEQPPIDDAYADFTGEQVDDTEGEVF